MKKGRILYEISTLKLKDSIVHIIEDTGLNYTAELIEKGSKKCLLKIGTKLSLNKNDIMVMEEM